MLRLDKYLSDAGIGTRREVKTFIRKGLVKVAGREKPLADMKIDEKTAEVYFDGERLEYPENVYLLMNKPPGVISATFDPEGADVTVVDILPERYRRLGLFPAGRLDKDAVGLLPMTNDGTFAHRLTSPKKNVVKTYYAIAEGSFDARDAAKFREGLAIDGGDICRPAELYTLAEYAENNGPGAVCVCRKGAEDIITAGNAPRLEFIAEITEGKYHQVKRMFAAVGKKVVYLKRIGYGPYVLPYNLGEGEVMALEDAKGENLWN